MQNNLRENLPSEIEERIRLFYPNSSLKPVVRTWTIPDDILENGHKYLSDEEFKDLISYANFFIPNHLNYDKWRKIFKERQSK